MKPPLPQSTSFEQFIQELPKGYHQQAYEFKAFSRARKIRSPLQLLQLVMLYCGLDLSLRSCAGEVAQLQGFLSDTAVKKRLSACVPWIKSLLNGVFGLDQPIIDHGKLRFIVIDGSTVQEPGAVSTTYRLHIAIDLINLSLRQVKVTTDKEGENLDHYALESGDVVLIDRGYNRPKSLVPFVSRDGNVILRYNAHGMNVYEKDEQGRMVKIEWQERLKTLNKKSSCVPVYLCYENKQIPVYIHAMPLPKEQADEARRKTKLRARKNGRTSSRKALYLSEWVLILSSLPPELLDTKTVCSLYRVRWQVEIVIKRLKSLLDIDRLRARKDSQLAELYLHGKLLYAAVVEKISQSRFGNVKRKMDGSRQITDWRLWRTVADEVKMALKACFPVCEKFIADSVKSLSERPGKRRLQALPMPTLKLIQCCREIGMSYV